MTRTVLAILLVSRAWGQTGGSIETPVLGLVFDPEAAVIRELTGIPAASRLGPALDIEAGVGTVAIASNRGYALAVDRSGTAVVVSRDGVRSLPGASSGATRVAVSPGGTASVLCFGNSRTCQVFTGMPQSAKLAASIPLSEDPADLAVSDDGGVILALSRNRRGGDTLYAIGPEGEPQVRYRAGRIAAFGFMPGSADALVAEPRGVKIVAPDLGQQPAGSDPDGGISAVAASPDRARVFIASRSGRIAIHDLRSSAETLLTCACSPRIFSALRGEAVFRLNDAGEGPLWLLDAGGVEPRIYFVADGGRQ